jgi:hypothetical protein
LGKLPKYFTENEESKEAIQHRREEAVAWTEAVRGI